MTDRTDITKEELDAIALTLERHPELFRVLRNFDPQGLFVARDTLPADVRFVVIADTESTGKDTSTDEIIELGLVEVAYDGLTGHIYGVTRTLNQMEEPTIPISPAASAVNGITWDMVAGKRIDDAAVFAIVDGADFVICHNSRFDRPMVERRFPFFEGKAFACTMAQVDWEGAGIRSAKQEYIASMLGFFYTAHRAENDCLALVNILRTSVALFNGDTPFQRLLEVYQDESYRVYAANAPFAVKGLLSDRKYHWADGTLPGSEKAWWIDVSADALDAELLWLKDTCFGGRPISLPVDRVTATTRFSNRRGERLRLTH